MMRRSVLFDASCDTAMLRSKEAPSPAVPASLPDAHVASRPAPVSPVPTPSIDPPGEPAGSIDIGRIVPPPSGERPSAAASGRWSGRQRLADHYGDVPAGLLLIAVITLVD